MSRLVLSVDPPPPVDGHGGQLLAQLVSPVVCSSASPGARERGGLGVAGLGGLDLGRLVAVAVAL